MGIGPRRVRHVDGRHVVRQVTRRVDDGDLVDGAVGVQHHLQRGQEILVVVRAGVGLLVPFLQLPEAPQAVNRAVHPRDEGGGGRGARVPRGGRSRGCSSLSSGLMCGVTSGASLPAADFSCVRSAIFALSSPICLSWRSLGEAADDSVPFWAFSRLVSVARVSTSARLFFWARNLASLGGSTSLSLSRSTIFSCCLRSGGGGGGGRACSGMGGIGG